MREVRRKWASIGGVLLMLAMAPLFLACGRTVDLRYRLTFEVEVDGEVKSASSIIDVLYYGGGTTQDASGATGWSQTKGVAPVIDLGRHGWLIAALDYDIDEAYRRKKLNQGCSIPKRAGQLPAAFELNVSDVAHVKERKRELSPKQYPAFIWVPYGAAETAAQQLCPEEFFRVIGANVTLRSVAIEIAKGALVATRLDIKAPWLDELRAAESDKISYRTHKHGVYQLSSIYLELK